MKFGYNRTQILGTLREDLRRFSVAGDKSSLQVKWYEIVRISEEVYTLHELATILCCRYIADPFFLAALFMNSLSSQLKFQWEIVVIASTVLFNCDA